MKIQTVIGVAALVLSVASLRAAASEAPSLLVAPGEYRCWTPGELIDDPAVDAVAAAELVSGFCKYRGRGINGKHAFRNLDTIPQRIIKRDAPNVVSYLEPRADSDEYLITWWIEGNDPNAVHPANHVIGRQLQLADVRYPLTRVPTVEVRAMVFSLDQTKVREIGFDIAANFVKTPGSNVGPFDQNSLDLTAGTGLLNIVGGLTDSVANAIQLGFFLSSEKSYSKEQLAITTLCPIGEFCTFEDTTDNYIMTPTGSQKGRLGIRYQLRPLLGLNDDEIKLDNMEFYMGLKTDDPLAPVNAIKPINFHTYILNDGELHVLGSEIREFDAKGTHLLGNDRASVHSRMILLLSVSMKKEGIDGRHTGVFTAKPVDRSFSPSELRQLDEGADLGEVLRSFEVVCFNDLMNPLREGRICGFHLTRMNSSLVDHWIEVRVDPKKRLKYPENQIRTMKLGDIYQGKGYYQIPMLSPSEGRNVMKISIELAEGGSGEDLRREYRARGLPLGIEFEFAHTSGHADPVDVRTSSIRPVKR